MSSWACRSFSERRARKNRGAIATKGSLNEFGWLIFTNVTSQPKVTEILNEIPRRLAPCAFACSLTLNPQKFDKLRMTYSAFVGWYMSKVLRIKNHIKKSTCSCKCFGTPWRIRTVDTKRRRLVLYPAELMVRILVCDGIIPYFYSNCKAFAQKCDSLCSFLFRFFRQLNPHTSPYPAASQQLS